MSVVWVDGVLVDGNAANVPIADLGYQVGDGVFETIKLRDGEPFALTRHLRRLVRSAEIAHLPAPDISTICAGIAVVCARHRGEGFLRITMTAGLAPMTAPRDLLAPRVTISVRPGSVRTAPTKVIVADWVRNERGPLVGAKSTSYAENVVGLAQALEAEASEILLGNTAGELCEGATSNVFVGFGDRLVTPPLSSGCLPGVTRALLLDAGVGVEERIKMTLLADATEIFLVSTGREVQPISQVDARELPASPGPLTLEAQRIWNEQIANRLDP